jgi:hypothetical protein
MAWLCNWPDYKARFQAWVEGIGGWGCLQSRLKDMEPHRQVYLGHVLKIFREPIRGFHDLLKQKPPSLLILEGWSSISMEVPI